MGSEALESLNISPNSLSLFQIGDAESACFTEISAGIRCALRHLNIRPAFKFCKINLHSINDCNDKMINEQIIDTLAKKQIPKIIFGATGEENLGPIFPKLLEKNTNFMALFPYSFNKNFKNYYLKNIVLGACNREAELDKILTFIFYKLKKRSDILFVLPKTNFGLYQRNLIKMQFDLLKITHPSFIFYDEDSNSVLGLLKQVNKKFKVIVGLVSVQPMKKIIFYLLKQKANPPVFIGTENFYHLHTAFEPFLQKQMTRGLQIYFTTSFPHPKNTEFKIIREYLKDLELLNDAEGECNKPSILSFNYYLNARITGIAIKRLLPKIQGLEISNEDFIKQLMKEFQSIEDQNFEDFLIGFDRKNHCAYYSSPNIMFGSKVIY